MTRAITGAPAREAPSSDASTSADAPSFIGDAFPAVTVPPERKTGFSEASLSTVVSGRMHSSRRSWPSPAGTTSASNQPASHAAAARWWEPSANASCSSRLIEYLSASTSAPSPRAMVHSLGMRGLVIRQPRVVLHSCS